MDDIGKLVSVIFPVLTVIIGGACILLFSVTTTLRTSNTDLRERVKDLEAKDTRNEVTIASQTAELEALRKVVTGEVHLVAITDLLEHHHTQAVDIWAKYGRIWDEYGKTFKHQDQTLVKIQQAIEKQVKP